jgi:putative SOS response-associated peptidase YedK
MCNLYSIMTNQAAIIALFRVINRYVGNLQPMPGVFPDYPAPVIRNSEGGPEMLMMRWGMPPPPRTGGPPVTNIRNTTSPHWRIWLRPEHRCLVPFNSFAEYAPEPNPETKKKDVVWFAHGDDRPLSAFAGIWTEFKGDRGTKSKPIPGPHLVCGFLTTSPNAVGRQGRQGGGTTNTRSSDRESVWPFPAENKHSRSQIVVSCSKS